MKAFYLKDTDISRLINQISARDDIKTLVHKLIITYDGSYTNFVFSIFSYYMLNYNRVGYGSEYYSIHETAEILKKFPDTSGVVLVADKFDMMYGVGCSDRFTKFNEHAYEEFYVRLTEILPIESKNNLISSYAEELFEVLENLFVCIEASLFSLSEKENDMDNQEIILSLVNNYGILCFLIA